jgi:hypothetical protein
MQVVNILIIRYLSVLTHLSHTFFPIPSHTTHLISLSLSLGDEIDSRSDLLSTAKARIQHET